MAAPITNAERTQYGSNAITENIYHDSGRRIIVSILHEFYQPQNSFIGIHSRYHGQ